MSCVGVIDWSPSFGPGELRGLLPGTGFPSHLIRPGLDNTIEVPVPVTTQPGLGTAWITWGAYSRLLQRSAEHQPPCGATNTSVANKCCRSRVVG
ncbi:hypothetical protein AGIG_G3452 [Arapaima gigas]